MQIQHQPSTYITKDIYSFIVEFISRAERIRNQLEIFDRELADNIKPLALVIDGIDVDGAGTFEHR
jgi:hypothetical protein